MDQSDVRQAFASVKEYVREAIVAFQEGAGSQDAPITAALTISAIWREIDLRAEMIGALAGTSWFRVDVKQNEIDEFSAWIDEELDFNSVQCVGAREADQPTVVYLTVGTGTSGRDALAGLLSAPGVISVRDWRWY